ncbi:MAG TPA: Cof-type HAD-IIB family hydrolase [Rhodopseudomonas sp.]|uniref:Cof-type HAD-IIB family hydrolase n=1 Tax=Rhodopseudomonas sp. TaxID=1078 RepID=UPI002ED98DA1
MNRIALVISDVDGTLVTKDKRLTRPAQQAVARLRGAGIGFTVTSSRPPVGMRMLVDPLDLDLPIGPFNGSSIVDPQFVVLEQHRIPAKAAAISLKVLADFAIDAWLFTTDHWFVRKLDGAYVAHEQDTIQSDPTLLEDFSPYLEQACKIVGASTDAALLERCEQALQQALGGQALAVRSQSYYLDVTPPGQDKGSFVRAMAKRLGITTELIATIGDMQNDLPMFRCSGLPIAMGNATPDVQRQARHVTASNEDEGFAAAVDFILKQQAAS